MVHQPRVDEDRRVLLAEPGVVGDGRARGLVEIDLQGIVDVELRPVGDWI